MPGGVELTVVQGNTDSVVIMGSRAIAPKLVILGAPDLKFMGDGHWFFEIKVYGSAVMPHFDSLLSLECRVGFHHGAQSATGSSPTLFSQLPDSMSCSLRGLGAAQHGHGVVGCALTVSENGQSFKACFALDGHWGTGLKSDWRENGGWKWSGSSCEGRVYPAISGRFVCDFAFEPGQFTYGPPDASFRPAAEAIQGYVAGAYDGGPIFANTPAAMVFGAPDSPF